jgi:hypothetical protein
MEDNIMNLSEFNIDINHLDFMFSEIAEPHIQLDKETLVAYWKLKELSEKIKHGNYLLKSTEQEVSESIVLLNLTNCILAYQACYDYALQILFWGFGFNDDFSSTKEYSKQLKDKCRPNSITKNKAGESVMTDSEFTNKLNNFSSKNQEFNAFYEKFKKQREYANDSKYGINSWANCIKHQGGFVTKEFYNNFKSENLLFESKENTTTPSFDTQILYRYIISKAKIIEVLEKQNNHIVEFAQWLYHCIFPQRSVPQYNSTPLPNGNILLTINHES